MKRLLCNALLMSALAAWATDLRADHITTASLEIGGAGSFGSNGSFDPGTLDDGSTLASANVTLTYDSNAKTLTIDLENTSPVFVGEPNPLLTELFVSFPRAVTGVMFADLNWNTSPTGPRLELSFDPDVLIGIQHNDSAFGAFSLRLSASTGMPGGFANAAADTINADPADVHAGPASIKLHLLGNLEGLEAEFFARAFSYTTGGVQASHLAGSFEKGGPAGTAAGLITDTLPDCAPLLQWDEPPMINHDFTFIFSAKQGCHGCAVWSSGKQETPITDQFSLQIGPDLHEFYVLTLNDSAYHKLTIPIPNNPGLVGVVIAVQWIAFDGTPSNSGVLGSNVFCDHIRDDC
ncbi:MAG: hypothetical protein RL885_32980 [Planctomycetota bacterium]